MPTEPGTQDAQTGHPCRLFCLLARQAPVGLMVRRGPSTWVQLSLWHTDTDEIEYGQWFHGRLFVDEKTVLLNFSLSGAPAYEGHEPPSWLKVSMYTGGLG